MHWQRPTCSLIGIGAPAKQPRNPNLPIRTIVLPICSASWRAWKPIQARHARYHNQRAGSRTYRRETFPVFSWREFLRWPRRNEAPARGLRESRRDNSRPLDRFRATRISSPRHRSAMPAAVLNFWAASRKCWLTTGGAPIIQRTEFRGNFSWNNSGRTYRVNGPIRRNC